MSVTRIRHAFPALLLALFSGHLNGQVVLFRDDFEGTLADDWIQEVGQLGTREIAGGYYVLTPDSGDVPMNPALDGMPDEISIRASFLLVGERPSSGFVATGGGGRDELDDGTGPNLWGLLATDGRYGIGGDRNGMTELYAVETVPHFDPFDTEVEFQLDLIGDEQFFTAWELGTEMPGEPMAVSTETGISGEYVWITHNNVGVNASELISAAYGYFEVVGFSPCNLNREASCDITDIDALVASGDLAQGFEVSVGKIVRYDLNRSGLVDTTDLNKWLTDAANANGFSSAYLQGDGNLDGTVDSLDLNALALNWNQDADTWSRGDFSGDGKVDASDLNLLALHWNESISPVAAVVPEPMGVLPLVVALTIATFVCRRGNTSR